MMCATSPDASLLSKRGKVRKNDLQVTSLTWTRKRKGTRACEESGMDGKAFTNQFRKTCMIG
jgi:hypothetical protein